MPTSSFTVENNLIDRSDLNIYEKMCSVVLARYAGRAEFSNMLNIQVIAIRMGCGVEEAQQALNSLIAKKLVMLEDADRIEPELLGAEPIKAQSRVIRAVDTQVADAREASLEQFDEPEPEKLPEKPPAKKRARKKKEAQEPSVESPVAERPGVERPETEIPAPAPVQRPLVPKQVRESQQALIDQVFEIVEENINDREARIILSFAGNDIERIKAKYRIAKSSQASDKIEMLINELQKRDDQPGKPGEERPKSGGQAAEPAASMAKPEAEKEGPAAASARPATPGQIDLQSINRMVAFKQSSYGKSSGRGK